MINGHSDVTCWADMRTRMILKHRKTALCTAGELGIVRRLSASRSEIWDGFSFPDRQINARKNITLDFWHLFLVLVDVGAEDDKGQPLQKKGPLFQLLFFAAE